MNALTRIVQSLAFRLALIPVIGVVVLRVSQSALIGLAAAIAAALGALAIDRLQDWHRRELAKREHIAGLGRW